MEGWVSNDRKLELFLHFESLCSRYKNEVPNLLSKLNAIKLVKNSIMAIFGLLSNGCILKQSPIV